MILFAIIATPVILITVIALSNIRSDSIEQYQQSADNIKLASERKVARSLQQFTMAYESLRVQTPEQLKSASMPGLIGFFQLSAQGRFDSPLLPIEIHQQSSLNWSETELAQRLSHVNKVFNILAQNHISQHNPYMVNVEATKTTKGQNNRDLSQRPAKDKKSTLAQKNERKAEAVKPSRSQQRQHTKQNQEFKINVLPSGHLMLHRAFERHGEWFIEGALVAQNAFFSELIISAYTESPLATFTQLVLKDKQLTLFKTNLDAEQALASFQLAAPLNDITMSIHFDELPQKKSAVYIWLLSLLLLFAVASGLTALYRMLRQQIALSQRQQGFISSMSHELKTPITSIKMYGDALQQGWLDDSKKHKYYQHITGEAERLSRLIDNLLQASNISRNALNLAIQPIQINSLQILITTKTSVLFEQSGFDYQLIVADSLQDSYVLIDVDAFSQVAINLVDNAIKYASDSDKKRVDIAINPLEKKHITIHIRDYGIGINKQEINKVFDLFYRVGNELTRTSKGTGLGLTLVKELVELMSGNIDVVSHSIGTEFIITLPTHSDDDLGK